jgi:hypothetical protein
MKTRKLSKHGRRKAEGVQHHHFLLRMETSTCPTENDKDAVKNALSYIIRDIDMKLLAAQKV